MTSLQFSTMLAEGVSIGFLGAKVGEALGWHIQIGDLALHHYLFLLIALAVLIALYPLLRRRTFFPLLVGFCLGGVAEEYWVFDWLLIALFAVVITTISIFVWLPMLFRELLAVKLVTAIVACVATSLLLVQVDFGALEAGKGVIVGLVNALLSGSIWYATRRRIAD